THFLSHIIHFLSLSYHRLFLSHITKSCFRFLPLEMRFQLRNGSDSAIRGKIDLSKELRHPC
ncbi:hypothetical protein GIB67_034286, partial [Kingdonia uniflora]